MQTQEIEVRVLVSEGHTDCCWGLEASEWPARPPEGNGDIQTQLLLRTMSGSMVLMRLGYVLQSKSFSATKPRVGATT